MLTHAIKSFWKDEEAATAVEYALIVALIGVAIAATVDSLGDAIVNLFNRVATTLGSV